MHKMLLIIRTFPASILRLFSAQALLGIGTGVFSVLLNLYLREIGYSEEMIGRLLAAQSLCAAIMSIPMGWLADRASRRTTYLLGVLLLGTGYSVLGLTRSLYPLFTAAFLAGTGSGAMMVSVLPYLQENGRHRQRKYIFSVNVTLMWITSVFAGFIAGWLPRIFKLLNPASAASDADRLQYSLWVGIIFIFFALIPSFGMAGRSEHASEKKEPHRENLDKKPLETPWLLIGRFAFCNALIGFGAGMIVPYFNLYFRDWVGSSIPQIGFVFALGQFGTALGSILSPAIAGRFGLIRGVVYSQLCSLPFMALMAWRHEFWVCAVCFVFRGAFMNMCVPMRQETMMEIIPAELRSRASAVDSMSWNLTWAFAMFFSGGVIKNWGYDVSLLIAFACYLASALSYRHMFNSWKHLSRNPRRARH